MGEVGEIKILNSFGISREVVGDLETDTGIWEETNYCLPVSLSFLLCVCLCMHLARASSLLDFALRAK